MRFIMIVILTAALAMGLKVARHLVADSVQATVSELHDSREDKR